MNLTRVLGFPLLAFSVGAEAVGIDIAQTPLYFGGQVPPNIMLMLDNSGSMQNIVPDAPYDPETVYLSDCPSESQVPTGVQVETRISSDIPYIRYNNTNYPHGTIMGMRCFIPDADYMAKLYADSSGSPSSYLPARYKGNYLNWYFSMDTDPGTCSNTWSSGRKPCTRSRMMIAQAASKSLIDAMGSGMRAGLSTYYSGNGGSLREIVGPLDNAKKTALKTKIEALTASGTTPLAETLSDIGRYFTTGYNGSLTLHPGQPNQTTATVAEVFNNHSFRNDSGQTIVSPITHSCQKTFSVLLTDGRPQQDRNISSYLRDYTGDCAAGLCIADSTSFDLPTEPLTTIDRKNGTKVGRSYETQGSDYLDDVAKALYEMDLRPDLVDPQGAINNVVTYVIGFADDQAINDPLIMATAEAGDGQFMIAGNEEELVTAFRGVLSDIAGRTSSAAAIATNSTRLDADTFIYQARFSSEDWSGHLLAYKVNEDDGSVGDVEWNASEHVPAAASRNIFTLNSETRQGAEFKWGEIGTANQAALDNDQNVLNYLRGDDALEVRNGGGFRNRNERFRIGDIVNSDPWFVGKESFGYGILPEPEGTSYPDFLTEKADRPPVVYVGANDGMLHGFHAGKRDEGGGVELLAYIPAGVYGRLKSLSDPAYNHRYFVDGSPRAGDIFVRDGLDSGEWRTILAGTTGAGGRSVFALDVSDPADFDASDVMWEFGYQAGVSCTAGVKGCKDIGYGIGQPSIVRLANGHWGVVFGNGYHIDDTSSDSYTAKLFIVDAVTGELIKMIDTKQGSSAPNGLATPIVVDLNGDRIADRVYGGDLLGNMWRFDIGSASSSDWAIPFIGPAPAKLPLPLFVATDPSGNRQPITAKPQVGIRPEGGLMVYFGTGKYFSPNDNIIPADPQVQTFYGVHDYYEQGDTLPTRAGLLQQEILIERSETYSSDGESFTWDIRIVSKNTGDSTKGWRIDLVKPAGIKQGERVVSAPLLWRDRVIFTTLIPDPNPCAFGGTGWIMELDPLTGGRLGFSVFDLNGDNAFDSGDYAASGDVDVPVSGKKSKEGIIKTPGVVSADTEVYKYTSGSSGDIEVTANAGEGNRGRQSWQQLR